MAKSPKQAAKSDPADGATHVRIAAKRDGFRRAGIAHPKAATLHPIERFTPDQLDALRNEPMLLVDFVTPEPPAD